MLNEQNKINDFLLPVKLVFKVNQPPIQLLRSKENEIKRVKNATIYETKIVSYLCVEQLRQAHHPWNQFPSMDGLNVIGT